MRAPNNRKAKESVKIEVIGGTLVSKEFKKKRKKRTLNQIVT